MVRLRGHNARVIRNGCAEHTPGLVAQCWGVGSTNTDIEFKAKHMLGPCSCHGVRRATGDKRRRRDFVIATKLPEERHRGWGNLFGRTGQRGLGWLAWRVPSGGLMVGGDIIDMNDAWSRHCCGDDGGAEPPPCGRVLLEYSSSSTGASFVMVVQPWAALGAGCIYHDPLRWR